MAIEAVGVARYVAGDGIVAACRETTMTGSAGKSEGRRIRGSGPAIADQATGMTSGAVGRS